MVRPIDANALLIQMKEYLERREEEANMTGNRSACVTWDDAVILIKNAPTVDAEPVRHGKWVDSEAFKRPWFRHHIFECSVCRNTLDMDGVNAGRGDANYCPNCGAKMDGREENETIRSASGY
jgi:hypothetical protein